MEYNIREESYVVSGEPGAMNIREFAKLCGVSHAAVSRVLNYPQAEAHVSRATYDRIRAKAEEVNFQVNYHAKALHSKNSGCIGFVIGHCFPMLTEPVLFGLSKVLKQHGKCLSIQPCESTFEAEAEAFEQMLYQHVDAILYIPSLHLHEQPYTTRHIQELVAKYPEHPPVVTMYGGTDLPGFYQLRFHDYETGRQAALRQLALGCRKFSIIMVSHTTLMNREMARGYRETLLNNGVLPENIREMPVWSAALPDLLAPFEDKDTEGVWACHYIPFINSIKDLLLKDSGRRKLHIDSVCAIETENVFKYVQTFPSRSLVAGNGPDVDSSIVIRRYSLHEIGRRGAETALALCSNDSRRIKSLPLVEYMELEPGVFLLYE